MAQPGRRSVAAFLSRQSPREQDASGAGSLSDSVGRLSLEVDVRLRLLNGTAPPAATSGSVQQVHCMTDNCDNPRQNRQDPLCQSCAAGADKRDPISRCSSRRRSQHRQPPLVLPRRDVLVRSESQDSSGSSASDSPPPSRLPPLSAVVRSSATCSNPSYPNTAPDEWNGDGLVQHPDRLSDCQSTQAILVPLFGSAASSFRQSGPSATGAASFPAPSAALHSSTGSPSRQSPLSSCQQAWLPRRFMSLRLSSDASSPDNSSAPSAPSSPESEVEAHGHRGSRMLQLQANQGSGTTGSGQRPQSGVGALSPLARRRDSRAGIPFCPMPLDQGERRPARNPARLPPPPCKEISSPACVTCGNQDLPTSGDYCSRRCMTMRRRERSDAAAPVRPEHRHRHVEDSRTQCYSRGGSAPQFSGSVEVTARRVRRSRPRRRVATMAVNHAHTPRQDRVSSRVYNDL